MPPALDLAVAEVAARQRALKGEQPLRQQTQQQYQAAPPMPPMARPPLPTQDISGLEEQLRKITDQIETFTENGLLLKSGEHLDADIIVTATGLVMKLFSGMQLIVDGTPVDMPKTLVYKGMMFSDVPNLAFAVGYTNASWTLKCDLAAEYVCRLVNYMDQHGYEMCTPRVNDPDIEDEPVIDFSSGYVLRALDTLPRQGSKTPWRLHQNYVKDLSMMRYGRVDDGTMEFSHR